MKRFSELTEQEVLALAISNEDEDSRIYRGFAEGLRGQYESSAKIFDGMAEEEAQHRTMLFDLYKEKFGDYLPLIRRQDVRGFIRKKPLWLMRPLGLDEVRKHAAEMEYEAAHFYHRAAESARDINVRKLLTELADAEEKHETLAQELDERILTKKARAKEDETSRRVFVLQYVLLLHVMQVSIPLVVCFWLMSVFYLVMAVAPTIGFIDLPVRITASWVILKWYTHNEVCVSTAALGIWLINLVIPAIIGSLLILNVKILKEK